MLTINNIKEVTGSEVETIKPDYDDVMHTITLKNGIELYWFSVCNGDVMNEIELNNDELGIGVIDLNHLKRLVAISFD